MNHADGLLASILERPSDPTPWLVTSDWLEEQGDPANAARAELFRVQARRVRTRKGSARQRDLDVRAAEVLTACPEVAGPLQPLLDRGFPVLSARSAVAIFLMADQTSVVAGRFAAGSVWVGEQMAGHIACPTTVYFRKRQGNRFSGDMDEDFSTLFGQGSRGVSRFHGAVVAGSHVAFVTWKMTGDSDGPALYQLRLKSRRRLTGTWQVWTSRSDKMWLKQKED
jgi:uncharacterized protein (TIGR02996 family)